MNCLKPNDPQDHDMSHFQTPEPISVVLELRVADVRVAAGERPDTIVEVRPSDPSRRDDLTAAEQTRVEYADGRLLVKGPRRLREWSPFSDGGSIDVDIQLPAGSELNGHTVAGGFRCTGPLGRCELKSSAGALSVDHAADVKLATAGDISLGHVSGDAELTTATGDVRAGEIGGAAAIKNANGDTRIGTIGGDLRVKAANGDIDVGDAHRSVVAKTANGHIRLGSVHGGSVAAETAAGHVEVGVADGVAAWLDLRTHYGHVHNGLDASEVPGPADEQVQVRARTGFGDITIRREVLRSAEPVAGVRGHE
jgi:putative adhesin